jgi:hypothetical protein
MEILLIKDIIWMINSELFVCNSFEKRLIFVLLILSFSLKNFLVLCFFDIMKNLIDD